VGSDRDIAVDVRVVAATNKNLRGEITRGTFREDLYHRLGVIIIQIPPLCERTEDIPMLVEHFTENICREYGIARKSISGESIEELCRMPWRGNVRELRNVVERLIILGGDHISIEDVHAYVSEFV
jgi:DNA-binding NtrC family response regulator